MIKRIIMPRGDTKLKGERLKVATPAVHKASTAASKNVVAEFKNERDDRKRLEDTRQS